MRHLCGHPKARSSIQLFVALLGFSRTPSRSRLAGRKRFTSLCCRIKECCGSDSAVAQATHRLSTRRAGASGRVKRSDNTRCPPTPVVSGKHGSVNTQCVEQSQQVRSHRGLLA
jgi:hypothetical protein